MPAIRVLAAIAIVGGGVAFAHSQSPAAVDPQVKAEIEAVEKTLRRGFGTTKYLEAASPQRQKTWESVAANGVREVQYMVAVLAYLRKDVAKQVEWAKKSADADFGPALSLMGYFHQTGSGVKKDWAATISYHRKAVKTGYGSAFGALGDCFLNGIGVKKDSVEAFRLYKQAADLGDLGYLTEVAICLSHGIGVKKNDAEAYRLFRKAADAGHPKAMGNVGDFLILGRNVAEDVPAAFAWYRKGAEAGDPHSQCQTAIGYEDGAVTLVPDLPEAIFWYRHASAKGYEPARKRLLALARNAQERVAFEGSGLKPPPLSQAEKSALRQLASLLSGTSIDGASGQPISPNVESLFVPARQGVMHQPDIYADAVKRVQKQLEELSRHPNPRIANLAAAGQSQFLRRVKINLANEEHGNTMASSLGVQRRKFFADFDPVLLGSNSKRFAKALGAVNSLVKEIADRDSFSGIAAYADMAVAEKTAELWGRDLVDLAATTLGGPSEKISIEFMPLWRQETAGGDRFKILQSVAMANRSKLQITHVLLKARFENEWREYATGYYYFGLLKPGAEVRLKIPYRFTDRYAPCSKEVRLCTEIWAQEGSQGRTTTVFLNPKIMRNYLETHGAFRKNEAPFLELGTRLNGLLDN